MVTELHGKGLRQTSGEEARDSRMMIWLLSFARGTRAFHILAAMWQAILAAGWVQYTI